MELEFIDYNKSKLNSFADHREMDIFSRKSNHPD